MNAMIDVDVDADLTPEVVCRCSCGRIYTRQTFEKLPAACSEERPDGRVIYDDEIYEFRICHCKSCICAKS